MVARFFSEMRQVTAPLNDCRFRARQHAAMMPQATAATIAATRGRAKQRAPMKLAVKMTEMVK